MPGAQAHPKTAEWWAKQPDAWAAFAMAVLKTDYRDSTKRNMPKHWFDDLPHSHVPLDDAIEQGALFCNMLRQSRS